MQRNPSTCPRRMSGQVVKCQAFPSRSWRVRKTGARSVRHRSSSGTRSRRMPETACWMLRLPGPVHSNSMATPWPSSVRVRMYTRSAW